jgi:hypothetical protein
MTRLEQGFGRFQSWKLGSRPWSIKAQDRVKASKRLEANLSGGVWTSGSVAA